MTNKYREVNINIIEQCLNNDRRAYLKLYDLYVQSMFNTCVWMLKDKMIAEEVMQDAFVSAFKNLSSYKQNASFGTWLKRIMVNHCINELKRKKLEWVDLNQELNQIPEAKEEIPQVDASELQNMILTLPDGYRIILSLYLIEGYDHEEIAIILNIKASTSRSQYLRAKKKLAELLSKENYVR